MRRVLIIVGAVLVVVVGVSVAFGPVALQKIRDAMPKPEGTVVRLMHPRRGTLVEKIKARGEI